ncbi:acylglycerol kinase family protein [Novosphingobium sp. 9U]|uniref:acylglycerol kinase family protein n=1 Tax=Novosphingobium sp. 9U TaxID=2653158 RepID=UPI0012F08870|nr:acylglycerol kinase family protein [Novosphingobium sp. 9U]VWX53791.1 Diacylglycerol kinase [Novosphingobium sp. 9U]
MSRSAPYAPRARAVPLVGIVRNPRSHRNKGLEAELADCSNILTEAPRSREALRVSLQDFAARGIDYLVIDGGDGTVRDVLTCGADIFGEEWPALIVLPKGKTNALAVDLGLPNHWSLAEALVAARSGSVIQRRPMRISSRGAGRDGGRESAESSILGFFLGSGVFTIGTGAGQAAHRRGAFNSFAVGLTIAWCIIQIVFGRAGNPFRASTRMRVRNLVTGRELPRRGPGKPDERFLAVASTFERFPLGLRLFGKNPPPGLKLAVLDAPVRWVLMLLPMILLGFLPRFMQRAGAHRVASGPLDFDLGGAFILDGEEFPSGHYVLEEGPQLTFVVP